MAGMSRHKSIPLIQSNNPPGAYPTAYNYSSMENYDFQALKIKIKNF